VLNAGTFWTVPIPGQISELGKVSFANCKAMPGWWLTNFNQSAILSTSTYFLETAMKIVIATILALCLTACQSAGGLVGGMGEDLQRAGQWIKSK
jgi:hypothetical protein